MAGCVVPLSGTSRFAAMHVHLDDAAGDAVGKRVRHLGDSVARARRRHRLRKFVACGHYLRRGGLRPDMELCSDSQGGATASGGYRANAAHHRTAVLRDGVAIRPQERSIYSLKKIALRSGGLFSLVFLFVFFCFFVGFSDRSFALFDALFIILDLFFVDKAKFNWSTCVVVSLAQQSFEIALV